MLSIISFSSSPLGLATAPSAFWILVENLQVFFLLGRQEMAVLRGLTFFCFKLCQMTWVFFISSSCSSCISKAWCVDSICIVSPPIFFFDPHERILYPYSNRRSEQQRILVFIYRNIEPLLQIGPPLCLHRAKKCFKRSQDSISTFTSELCFITLHAWKWHLISIHNCFLIISKLS